MKDEFLAALDQRKPKYNIYGCVIAFQLKLKKELLLTDLEKEQQVVKDVLVRMPFTSMTAAHEEEKGEEEEEVGDEEDEVSPTLVCNIAMTHELLQDLATPSRLVTSECERVYLPFYHESHWTLVVLEPPKREILLFDSLYKNLEERYATKVQVLKEYIPILFHMTRDKCVLEGGEWVVKGITYVPKQQNVVFVLKYIDFLCFGLPIAFNKADIVHFRKRMAFELMTGAALL
ncbi:hypothetical protein HHK36_019645 [Tetracentron sinense]|uniref:Ubiquitin-like protease family profile domain-containing protein n=1 Tax=Tetracentron sinense TaxID=13715 RepID=A0A834YXQ7_TETSI|nr:hypothetical protein HHK36_019645 [Tetracentron sinense]